MPDEKQIPEFYSDGFEVISGPYGIVLKFGKAVPDVHAETPREQVANIRMSWEHAKTMAYKMVEHVKKIENQTGVSYPIPQKILNDLSIPKEDWDSFWKIIT